MKKIIDAYSYDWRPVSHRRNKVENVEKYLNDFFGRSALVESSARVGIHQALKFFGLSRQDTVLVPDFLCRAILTIINVSGFPVKKADEKTKAVLVFHQWGYPQRMDQVMAEAKKRGLIVIEDFAHSFGSTYQGKLIGTFGDASVFSFAKCFPAYNGGVLVSQNKQLVESARSQFLASRGWRDTVFQYLAFRILKRCFTRGQWPFWLDALYFLSILFPRIGFSALKFLPPDMKSFKNELEMRKNHYRLLTSTIKKEYLLADQDPSIDVYPLYVPVFLPADKLPQAKDELLANGVQAEILHFDVNRNVFDSNYQKCLALPCHQQMQEDQFSRICAIINKA